MNIDQNAASGVALEDPIMSSVAIIAPSTIFVPLIPLPKSEQPERLSLSEKRYRRKSDGQGGGPDQEPKRGLVGVSSGNRSEEQQR